MGKYNELQDAYKSIYESFVHAGAVNECKVKVVPVHSELLEGKESELEEKLAPFDGILVAPGFGERGIKGKINAIKFLREKKRPFFGICLGMQVAVVEFAQHVLQLKGASSVEWEPNTPHPVIDLMASQKNIDQKGGTMRLGSYPCALSKNSKALHAYQKSSIQERHRHRYEFNNDYLEQIEQAGLKATGINPESNLVEIVELDNHPWFIGVQFHPELKSTVENPHPLFVGFVDACIQFKYKSS